MTRIRIKDKLLSFYTKRLLKARPAVSTNVGFRQAQNMGILYRGDSQAKHEAIHCLADRLSQLGKKVTTLCYAPPAVAVTNLSFPTVTRQDVGLWGNITQPQADAFVSTAFDYLYQVDAAGGDPELDYLVAKSQAKCRVGHYTPARTALFEVMVTIDSSLAIDIATEALIAQMLRYTQML
ncbi:MAG: hypothetical protein AAFQ08_01555 [Bacteroidota bacterium]